MKVDTLKPVVGMKKIMKKSVRKINRKRNAYAKSLALPEFHQRIVNPNTVKANRHKEKAIVKKEISEI